MRWIKHHGTLLGVAAVVAMTPPLFKTAEIVVVHEADVGLGIQCHPDAFP